MAAIDSANLYQLFQANSSAKEAECLDTLAKSLERSISKTTQGYLANFQPDRSEEDAPKAAQTRLKRDTKKSIQEAATNSALKDIRNLKALSRENQSERIEQIKIFLQNFFFGFLAPKFEELKTSFFINPVLADLVQVNLVKPLAAMWKQGAATAESMKWKLQKVFARFEPRLLVDELNLDPEKDLEELVDIYEASQSPETNLDNHSFQKALEAAISNPVSNTLENLAGSHQKGHVKVLAKSKSLTYTKNLLEALWGRPEAASLEAMDKMSFGLSAKDAATINTILEANLRGHIDSENLHRKLVLANMASRYPHLDQKIIGRFIDFCLNPVNKLSHKFYSSTLINILNNHRLPNSSAEFIRQTLIDKITDPETEETGFINALEILAKSNFALIDFKAVHQYAESHLHGKPEELVLAALLGMWANQNQPTESQQRALKNAQAFKEHVIGILKNPLNREEKLYAIQLCKLMHKGITQDLLDLLKEDDKDFLLIKGLILDLLLEADPNHLLDIESLKAHPNFREIVLFHTINMKDFFSPTIKNLNLPRTFKENLATKIHHKALTGEKLEKALELCLDSLHEDDDLRQSLPLNKTFAELIYKICQRKVREKSFDNMSEINRRSILEYLRASHFVPGSLAA